MVTNSVLVAATAIFCQMMLFLLSGTLLSLKLKLFVTGECLLSILKTTQTTDNKKRKPTKIPGLYRALHIPRKSELWASHSRPMQKKFNGQ